MKLNSIVNNIALKLFKVGDRFVYHNQLTGRSSTYVQYIKFIERDAEYPVNYEYEPRVCKRID